MFLPPVIENWVIHVAYHCFAGHEDAIFPYFMDHAREVYPHIDCLEDLVKISDMSFPANWYPEARSRQRKVCSQEEESPLSSSFSSELLSLRNS